MAKGKVVLEVVVEGKNVKVVQREVERVTGAVNENTKAQDRNSRSSRQNSDSLNQNARAARNAGDAHAHFDRGLKGAAGTAGSGAKNFSKMRDIIGGSSGLVGAYATLAANLFAATAAFNALQKAAAVEQLQQGLQALGTSTGLAMMSLSKGLQASTGYAINLQDSMRSVAMVTTAGFDPSTIERLGKVAKNTSVALGRDLQDSLNRLVKGAVKLEPELLDELGIMVRLDEASQMYARSVGKTASQLTNFEKRQAYFNAALAEGERKFGAIGDAVDANPYDKLLANLTELATAVLTAFNAVLTPIVSFLAQSKYLLAGFILSFSKGLVGSALPVLGQMAQKTSLVAQQNAKLAIREDKITQGKIKASKDLISQVNTEQKAFGNAAINRAKAADTEAKRTASISELKSTAALADKKALELEAAAKAAGAGPDPKAAMYKERAALLGTIITELETINALERQAISTVPKAAAATTKGSYYQATSDRFASVQENRSFSNYRAQWKGMSEDSAKFKTDVKAMNGQFTMLGRGLSTVAGKLGTYAATAQTASNGTSYLGRAADFLKAKLLGAAASADIAGAAAITFAERVKFAGLAMFEFMGVIGLVVMALTLLYQGVKWVIEQFKSDATKKYEKNLEDATSKTEELNKASQEVNKSLLNKSRTITTLADKIDAQANIVKQAADSYETLRDSAAAAGAGMEDTINLVDSQIDSNILLQRELATLTGGYTDLSKWKTQNNKTDSETIGILDELFKRAEKSILAQQTLSKAVQESGKAFTDYKNSLKNTTPYTEYVTKLEDIDKAYKALQESAKALNGTQDDEAQFISNFGAFGQKLEAMDPDQVAHMGEKFVALRDGVIETNKEITAITAKIDTLKTYKVADLIVLPPVQKIKTWGDAFSVAVGQIGVSNKILYNTLKEGYNQLLGEGKTAREEVNGILSSAGQETISIFTSQEEYNKRSEKAQTILDARKRGLIEAGKKISAAAAEELNKELNIIKTLERKAQLVETEKNNLETINKISEINGYQTSADLKEQETVQSRLFKAQEDSLQAQIHNTQRFRDETAQGSAERAAYESKILELINQLRLNEAEANKYKLEAELRVAKVKVKNLELVQAGERGMLDIIQQRIDLTNKELNTRQKTAELIAQIASLNAGGDGELSVAQNEAIFKSQLEERKKSIDDETNAKVRLIDLDATLNKAKLAILIQEMRVAQANLYTAKFRAGWFTEEAQRIQEQMTANAGVLAETQGLYNTYDSIADRQRNNAREEGKNARLQLSVEEKRFQNNLDSKQLLVDMAQAESDATSKLQDIISKMTEARSSIIDSEKTLLENKMKAENRKKTGKGELTAQQEADIAQKYLKRRLEIIDAERSSKITLIEMEYKLLEAKTRFEQLSLAQTIQKMKTRVKRPDLEGKNAADQQVEIVRFQNEMKDINSLSDTMAASMVEILRLIPGAKQLAIDAANATAEAAKSTAIEDAAAAREKADEESRTRKQRAYETELEFIKAVTDLQQKILDFNNSILDNERTVAENAQKAENLRNKGIGKFELTAAQNAQIEVDYQEKRKVLLAQERDIKMATIEAEYGLLDAQLAVQKWRMTQDVQRLRDEAVTKGDTKLAGRMDEMLGSGPNSIEARFAKAADLIQPTMIAAQRAATSEYEAGMSEATAAQIQAMEAAFGWTTRMTTSWKDVSTAINENFTKTLQDSVSITQQLADTFTNAVNSAVDGFVDAIVEGKNAFKAMGDAVRNSLLDGLAETAKSKLKEGIAGIFSSSSLADIPGLGDIGKFLTGPQERAATAAETTADNVKNTTQAITDTAQTQADILREIANNTAAAAKCCTSGGGAPGPAPDLGVKAMPIADWAKGKTIEASSANSNSSLVKPKVVLDPKNDPFNNGASKYSQDLEKLNKKSLVVNGQTYSASKDIVGNTGQTVKEVGFWGKATEYATNNVGTVAAAGFASIVTAIAAGRSAKSSIIGGVLGIAGSVIGGMVGGPAGAAAGGQIGAMLGARAGFANGGVMSSSGPLPLEKYAKGGVAKTPQLAMFGEGSKPEAYVPLPDGRSIPVSMSGGTGNVNNISVSVAVDNKGNAQTQTQSSDNSEEYSRRLGLAISNAVKQEMINQQRPGGLLYKGRR